jgi:hypothetical protein
MLVPEQVRREEWEWRPSGQITYLLCNACGSLLVGCEDPACELHHRGYYCDVGGGCPVTDISYDSDAYTRIVYDSYEDALAEAESYQFYVDVMLSYYGVNRSALADEADRLADDAIENAKHCRAHGLDARAVIDQGSWCDRYDSFVMIFDRGESDFFVRLERAKTSPDMVGKFLHQVRTDRVPCVLDQIAWSLRETPKLVAV